GQDVGSCFILFLPDRIRSWMRPPSYVASVYGRTPDEWVRSSVKAGAWVASRASNIPTPSATSSPHQSRRSARAHFPRQCGSAAVPPDARRGLRQNGLASPDDV